MNCTRCGEPSKGMLTMFNLSSMQAEFVCSRCQAIESAQRFESIEKLDIEIEVFEDLAKKYEELIQLSPDVEAPDGELSAYFMTPMTAYKGIQYFLAEYRARRMELLAATDSQLRLEYELQKSLEVEDYKKSAILRDAIKKMKEKNQN